MTRIYFVRHAQPDETWDDDRTRPLTQLGLSDRNKVTKLLTGTKIDVCISSPYLRSLDTIADYAATSGMTVTIDERLRERKSGAKTTDSLLEKRWRDFDFCEEGGETIGSVQKRNIDAMKDILTNHNDKSIVIGTHGTALSTIMNHYDSSHGIEWFRKIWFCMPYVIRLDFDCQRYLGSVELLSIERGY